LERERIRLKKEAGLPREQWTVDPILSTYRFCNVRRNDDRVTRELRAMAPLNCEDSWFWWVAARLLNKPETMSVVYPCITPFKPEGLRKTLNRLKEKGPIFNGAYIVSTNGIAMDKVDYIIDRVLTPLWRARARLRPKATDTLDTYHKTLCQYQGLGSFMAAQVIADLKYEKPLNKANDWLWWAASGPGSRRGLGRVMHDDYKHTYNETTWRMEFHHLWAEVNKTLRWKEPLTGQDVQNCLCEFDKMERARLGEGVPKQLYKERVI
jgi:hypothetical protein